MNYELLTSDEIVPDPEQVRKTFTGIEKLAESIREHGLLQNLVVSEVATGVYQIAAGERRWRAIRLLERDGFPKEKYLCLVKGGDATALGLIQLVENVERQDVSPWELGRRFLELVDAGMKQEEIAARSGCSQVKVSIYARIASMLAPGVVTRLNRLGPSALTLGELRRISSIYDYATSEPDEKKQIEILESIIGARKGRKRVRLPPGRIESLKRRFNALAYGQSKIPESARPVVEAVVHYLSGRTKTILWPEGFE